MCVKVIASQRWDVFLRHGVGTGMLTMRPWPWPCSDHDDSHCCAENCQLPGDDGW